MGNIIKQGLIIQKTYNVKYYKLISLDLKKCLYVILISKSIHSYLPPPPSHVSNAICTHLQELINQANTNATDIILTRIITDNLYNILKMTLNFIF